MLSTPLQIQRTGLASGSKGGRTAILSGFFTSVAWQSPFYGWVVWGVERLAGPLPGMPTHTIPPAQLALGLRKT